MRAWFSSEFTWRLYVVLQVAALVAFGLFVVSVLVDGKLLKYRPVYEEIKIDPAEVKAKCAHLSDDPKDGADTPFTRRWPDSKVSPRQACIDRGMQPRKVGDEFAGIKPDGLTVVLISFLLAFFIPFAVVRVPTWLWEGWRYDR